MSMHTPSMRVDKPPCAALLVLAAFRHRLQYIRTPRRGDLCERITRLETSSTIGCIAPCFTLMLHHADIDRESADDRASSMGRLDTALVQAQPMAWTVVEIKRKRMLRHPLGTK